MNVMVTGGAGFIGSHVVDALIGEGHIVYVIDDLSSGSTDNLNNKADFTNCDITSPLFIKLVEKICPEVIFHLAAQIDVKTSCQKPSIDANINILGSINVLEAAVSAKCRKVIYSSSAAVYGEPQYVPIDEVHNVCPLSPYGISKHTVEHYLSSYKKLFGLDYTVLRYANVYGPRQDAKGEGGVVSIFVDNALAGRTCVVQGSGDQTRDFIYVGDVAQANTAAMSMGSGEVINIGTNTEVSVTELLDMVIKVADKPIEVSHGPAREGDIFRSCLSNTKAVKQLRWKPITTLEEGLKRTYSWAETKLTSRVV